MYYSREQIRAHVMGNAAATARLLAVVDAAPLIPEHEIERVASLGIRALTRKQLTPAETQVLRLASVGLSEKQIVRALQRSPGTVKNHLRAARWKLDAENTVHACCEALRRGVIE